MTKNVDDFGEMESVRQRAALIAAAAAGTPLPPLSSLTPEEQRQYFEWIKRLPVNSTNALGGVKSTADSLPLPFTPGELFTGSSSLSKNNDNFLSGSKSSGVIGAIGSGRPRRQNINNKPQELPLLSNVDLKLQSSESHYFQPSTLSRASVTTVVDSDNLMSCASQPDLKIFADANESTGNSFLIFY